MIKKLELHNFRTHENTELNFSPSVNVIVGPSDVGKSNIMRALQWVVHNRPLGKKIIRRGKDETGVQVFTETHGKEISVLRAKGKNLNVYSLDIDGQEANFTAFGDSPPEEIKEALNLSDINIQKQSEWYFLAFDSPGHVAAYIRSITKLDEIDQVVKLLASKIRIQRGEISGCQTELKDVEDELGILSKIDLDGLEKAVKKTHSLLRSNEELTRKYEELETLLSELKEIEENLIFLPDDIDQVLEKSDRLRESFQGVKDEKESLHSLLIELEEIDNQKINLPSDLRILSSSKITEQEYNNTCKDIEELGSLMESLKEVEGEIKNSTGEVMEQIKVEKDLLGYLVECPECGQKLTEEAKKNLLGEKL